MHSKDLIRKFSDVDEITICATQHSEKHYDTVSPQKSSLWQSAQHLKNHKVDQNCTCVSLGKSEKLSAAENV